MKNSSHVADNVFGVNLKYAKLQNKTKELFFRCLEEDRDIEYFEAELKKIWGNNDIDYLEEQIIEYRALLHEINTNEEMTKKDKKSIKVVGLAVLGGLILSTNELFQKAKTKEYKTRKESYAYKINKEEYLKKLVPKYTSDVKPYYKKGEKKRKDNIVRFVKPSTYNSMVYNSTLTKNGWIQTLNDGKDMEVNLFYIKRHSFSCPHCLAHQEQIMTREECLDIFNTADEGATDLLHPNCKCELSFYNNNTKLDPIKSFSEQQELEQQYHIREQVMGLELKKEELLSDYKIYQRQGQYGEADKVKKRIEKVNSSIKDLQEALPTTELKKQVVARNR